MPVYEYFCDCGKRETAYRTVATRGDSPICHGPMTRQEVNRTFVSVDYPAYVSPATGKVIEGKRQHIEDLKRSGCRIKEPGETRDFAKNASNIHEANINQAVDQAVDAAARDLGMGC